MILALLVFEKGLSSSTIQESQVGQGSECLSEINRQPIIDKKNRPTRPIIKYINRMISSPLEKRIV